MFPSKTNQREVFDYIVEYQKLSKGELPTGRLIGRVFGLSGERGRQYILMFKRKVENLKK